MTLGQMLAWHRGLCGTCTADSACPEYLEIAAEYTQDRQRWSGPVAASTVLSVQEAT